MYAILLAVGALSYDGSIVRLSKQLHASEYLRVGGQKFAEVYSSNSNIVDWTPQLQWTIIDVVASVHVASFPAPNPLLTRHLPQTVRK
jgi:hypothetical protein